MDKYIQYHDEVITKEGFVLTVDMVRLTFKFKQEQDIYEFYEQMQFADMGMHCNLKREDIDPTRPQIIYDYYQSRGGFGKYKTLFKIYVDDKKEESFSLGIGLQNSKETLMEGFIEFNPNKCAGIVLEWILTFLQCHCKYLMLKRYDLALDVPIRADHVLIEKDKRKYELHSPNRDKQFDTEYLGCRNQKGRFKKYNKTKEYNDSHPYGEQMQYDVTRLEVTLESLDYMDCLESFPTVKVPSSFYPYKHPDDLFEIMAQMEEQEEQKQKTQAAIEKLKDTEKVLLELLLKVDDIQERHNYLKRCGRVMREKLSPLVMEDKTETILICEDDFKMCLYKLCEYCRLRNTIIVGKKSVNDDADGKRPEQKKKEKRKPEWCVIVDKNGEIFEGYDPVNKRWISKEAKQAYYDSIKDEG